VTRTPRPTRRPPRRTLAGIAVLTLLTVAACSYDDTPEAEPPPSTTTTSPAPTTNTAANPQAEAIAGYRAFWQAYLAAADPINPEDPRLAEHATGEELAAVRSAFLAVKSAGHVIRGTLDLAPRVVTAEAGTVVISDCYDDKTGLYAADTGVRQDKDDPERRLVTATVVLVDGVWKVSAVKNEGAGCTAS
jgi:hypothetical protein